jgi:septum formation protein
MLSELLKNKKIILASKSPRRKELLAGLDIEFETRIKEVDESYSSDIEIYNVAEFLADKKAKAFESELKDNEIIITSDTVVICNGEILEKPKSKIQAFDMLSKLSGKSHEVVTGVCLMSTHKKELFSGTTKVWFKKLSCDEMNYYIKKYEPFDKAGSYGIQEWIGYIGIEKIEGTYFNVMGLPVNLLYDKLQKFA